MKIYTIDLYFRCARPGELDVTNYQSKENRPKADRIKELLIQPRCFRTPRLKKILDFPHYYR